MHYTAKNCKINLNGREFLISDAQLNMQAQLEPVYIAEQRHSFYYAAQNGIGGTLSLNYLFTGNDYLKTLLNDERTIITGNIGGMSFNSGYLRSYGFTAQPNSPIPVKAEIVFFDDLDGNFGPTYEKARNIQPLLMSDAEYFDCLNERAGSISGITSFNYQFNSNIEPVYKAGDTTPYRITFKEKEINVQLQVDGITGYLPTSGTDAALRLRLQHPTQGILDTFFISGKLSQRELGASNKEFLKSIVNIRQNYIHNPGNATFVPTFVLPPVTPPFVFPPGMFIGITGVFGSETFGVRLGQTKVSFSFPTDSSGYFYIPEGAISGDSLILETFGGDVTISGAFPIANRPLGVSGVTPLTGFDGSSVRISGTNFYSISGVLFGSAPSNFSVISPNSIQATVPYDATWDYVTVLSEPRHISGRSPYKFVPIPKITGFSPNTGVNGDSITLRGTAFSGVTSGAFNNIISTSLTINSNNQISIQVPSGNTYGYIRLYGVSGVGTRSSDLFYPVINVTSITPSSSTTGVAVTIGGTNFFSELMYNTVGNFFLVSIGGATGQFSRTNSTTLAGNIPANASSGYAYVLDSHFRPYPSTAFFTLLYGQPFISGVFPNSGRIDDRLTIEGTNLFNATTITLSRGASNNNTSGISVSTLGDLTSSYVPDIAEGNYNVIVNTNHGSATGISGTAQGFYLMKDPTITAFIPTSGGIGTIINLTGTNLYPQSRIFFNNSGIEATKSSGVLPNYTQLQFAVPIGASGTNTIYVYNGVGNAVSAAQFSLIQSPFISGFNPLSGEWGQLITVTGGFLDKVTGVYVGSGRYISGHSIINSNQITFNIPTGLVSDFIYAYGQGGFSRSVLPLISLPPIIRISGFHITGIRPARQLLITGNYLSGTNEIWFSGQTKPVTGFTRIGQTGIYVNVPRNTVSGYVTLVNSRGPSISPNILNIIPDPTITFVSPTFGVNNQLISIRGTDLTGMKFFFKSANTGLWSGLIEAGGQLLVSSTGATFTVPRNIINGPIAMSGDFEVFFGWTGTFIPLPSISGFNPTGGPSGTLVTITGYNALYTNNLLFATGHGDVQVVIDPLLSGDHSRITGAGILNPTTGYSLWSGFTNNNFAGFGNLFLISDVFTGVDSGPNFRNSEVATGITKIISQNQFYFAQHAPEITGFYPVRGNTNTVVSVSGINLRYITGLYINDSLGTILDYTSGNLDTVRFKPGVNPLNSSGQILGVSFFGNTISTQYFTYIGNPDILGFYPTRGIVGTAVRISGTDFDIITGVSFGDFNAQFVIAPSEGSTDIVTGYVPDVTYSLPRSVLISLWNDAGVGQAGYFTIYSSGAILTYRTSDNDLYPIPQYNGQLLMPHGLEGVPNEVSICLVNRTAEYGYVRDDEVNLTETTTQSLAGGEPFSIGKDATNIVLSQQFGTYPRIEIMNKVGSALITGGVSTGSWKLRGNAYRQILS